jgi:NAD(P) transhydrogenase
VIEREREAIHDRLRRKSVDVLVGTGSFVDPYTLEVRAANGRRRVSAERFVIAVGTTPTRPETMALDGRTVLNSDEIRRLSRIPRTLAVIGAGVIGLEYATMVAALGVHVTVVERQRRLLRFVDEEIVEALQYHLCGFGLQFRLGEEVKTVQRVRGDGAVLHLRSGMQLHSEVVLHTAGRQGATCDLNLAAAGLEADERGRIVTDAEFRTAQAHIYAAGDVVGFPSLAATSMEQGRLAALAAFGEPAKQRCGLLPYGIYTIPEISFVGPRERDLREEAIPYVVGTARYRELTRGEISGDRSGFLKLLVHAETRRLLGVHIFGNSATELVHLGQTVIAADLTVDYLLRAVFNVPTFADAYRVAALDACNRLTRHNGGRAATTA